MGPIGGSTWPEGLAAFYPPDRAVDLNQLIIRISCHVSPVSRGQQGEDACES